MADQLNVPSGELTRVNDRINRSSPFGQFEIKTLTMAATADTDTAITHSLRPLLPTDVGYIIIQQNAAGDVYHDLSVDHREWTSSTVYLRSTVAALRVSILLFVPNKSLAATTLTGTATGSPPWSALTTAVTANYIFAGPATGAAAVPTFRTMVVADVPTLNQNTTGYAGGLAIASQAIYDTYYALSATTTGRVANGTTGQVYTATTGAAPSWASPAVATSLTVADTTAVSCYVALWEGATGVQAAKSDAGLTYNASTGVLTATGFSGPLVGNVTGNASGTADTVTNATQASITSIANLATVGTITSGTWNAGSVTSSSGVSDSVGSMATIRAGGIGIASQAALDFIYGSSTTQLGRLAKGSALQYPRINATETAWEFATPAVAWPVGSVFIAVVNTNPNTLLGYGTWTAFGTGRMLIGLDSGQAAFDTVEETGGATTHTHTGPSHTHSVSGTTNYPVIDAGSGSTPIGSSVTTGDHYHAFSATSGAGGTGDTGSGSSMPPYIVVYMWKRTA